MNQSAWCQSNRYGMPKPPLGLRPRRVVDGDRAIEICEALKRYAEAGHIPPLEWIEELKERMCR